MGHSSISVRRKIGERSVPDTSRGRCRFNLRIVPIPLDLYESPEQWLEGSLTLSDVGQNLIAVKFCLNPGVFLFGLGQFASFFLRASGASWRAIAKELGLGVGTVRRAVNAVPKTSAGAALKVAWTCRFYKPKLAETEVEGNFVFYSSPGSCRSWSRKRTSKPPL